MIKYNKYKPSGVEWIGDIPEHWGKYRLKNISISVNGYSFKSEDFDREYDIPVIRIGDVGDIIDFEDCIKVKSKFLEEKKDFIVKKNDILIGLTGGTIGKSGRYNYEIPSLLNQRVGLLRNKKEVLNGLLYHYVKSEVFIRYIFYDCYGGGQDNISMNDILNMVFPLPPSQEQHQIVQFLDSKTELIDKLISTKERKISLLKEQRTSIINQVVTKGLNSNVKMKDSGSEFIGKIPESWKCTKLGFYTKKIGSGSTPRGGSEVYVDSGVPFVRSQNVHFDGLRLDGVSFIDFETHKSMKGSTVVRGDVLLNITGGSIGRCCVVEEENEMNVNQHVSIIRTTVELLNYYLNYLLGSDIGQSQVLFNLTGGNREGLTIEGIRNFFITIPNLKEQLEIVKHIEFKNKEIDDLVHLEQKKINLLKEYRQSLISEVVTGKIKVTTDE